MNVKIMEALVIVIKKDMGPFLMDSYRPKVLYNSGVKLQAKILANHLASINKIIVIY